MKDHLLIVPLLVLLVVAAAPGKKDEKKTARPDPIDSYEKLEIEGWTLRISEQYQQREPLKKKVLHEIRTQLHRIAVIVPKPALKKMRDIEIWIEYDFPGRCQYHPNKQWLINNGYSGEKVGTIEIPTPQSLLSWRRRPVMTLLHELAHAYHDQVLGFDEPRIKSAFEKARADGKYEQVQRDTGGTVKHYALTDHKEYFAECSEAYLWVNDYEPFVRGDLQRFDPDMHKLLGEIWSE